MLLAGFAVLWIPLMLQKNPEAESMRNQQ